MNNKETLWLIGTAAFVLILISWIFGIEKLSSNSVVDVSLHDTYLVLSRFQLIFYTLIISFFTVYLIRMLSSQFENLTVNLIFISSGMLSIWMLINFISFVNSYSSELESAINNNPASNNVFRYPSTILYIILVAIIGLIVYSGFRTWKNYKKAE